MKTLRVLIVDDEPLARENIRCLLGGDPDIGEILEAGDGEAALGLIRELRPDLVFMDVQMPKMDGLSVVQQLETSELPIIVFVTAYNSYAVQAFEVNAIDYLLKPFSDARFADALQRIKQAVQARTKTLDSVKMAKLIEFLGRKDQGDEVFRDRLIIRSAGDLLFLRTDDVYWLEAQGDYVKIHTREKNYLIRETLGHMEEVLDPSKFIRVHRSTIVNMRQIRKLSPLSFGDYALWLENGMEIKVSRTFHAKLSALVEQ